MSRAIVDAPMICPSASLMGETVSAMSICLPSLRTRFVSMCETGSPRLILSMMWRNSSSVPGGNNTETDCPMISSAVHP